MVSRERDHPVRILASGLIMDDDDKATIEMLQAQIGALNDTLKIASRKRMQVDLDVVKVNVLGSVPILRIHGFATRSKVEWNERLS